MYGTALIQDGEFVHVENGLSTDTALPMKSIFHAPQDLSFRYFPSPSLKSLNSIRMSFAVAFHDSILAIDCWALLSIFFNWSRTCFSCPFFFSTEPSLNAAHCRFSAFRRVRAISKAGILGQSQDTFDIC